MKLGMAERFSERVYGIALLTLCFLSRSYNNDFFTCSNMGAVVCDYLVDDARHQHDFLTMNRRDGQLQFYTKAE
jgi:hypothetical protein